MGTPQGLYGSVYQSYTQGEVNDIPTTMLSLPLGQTDASRELCLGGIPWKVKFNMDFAFWRIWAVWPPYWGHLWPPAARQAPLEGVPWRKLDHRNHIFRFLTIRLKT